MPVLLIDINAVPVGHFLALSWDMEPDFLLTQMLIGELLGAASTEVPPTIASTRANPATINNPERFNITDPLNENSTLLGELAPKG
jgi:hypothetical protein